MNRWHVKGLPSNHHAGDKHIGDFCEFIEAGVFTEDPKAAARGQHGREPSSHDESNVYDLPVVGHHGNICLLDDEQVIERCHEVVMSWVVKGS